MTRRELYPLVVMLSLLTAGPARALAPAESDRGLLLRSRDGEAFTAPIVGTAVAMRVTGVVARSRVTQVFLNPTKEWVEGIYVFPLPEGAVVDSLRMTVGSHVLTGVVREREQAAAVYQQAKAAGHRASLVDMLRPGVFSTAVANLGPGETVDITIELQQVVEYGRGRFGLRFPMVVPPRYAPPAQDALPIPPPVAGPAAPSFSFHLDLAPGFPLGRVSSPSHQITVARDRSAQRCAIDLAAGVAPADADFLLEWTPAVGRQPHAVSFTETVNGERYALLMVMPPDVAEAAAARLPRETVFVIDTSGSMEGTSLEQARQALLLGLDRLAPTDAFNVIRFSSTASALFPASVPADRAAIEQAKAWVRGLAVDGGTEMLPALQLALPASDKAGNGLLRQVIFATDGQVSNEAELLQFIADHLGASRLYSVAIGSSPNAAFLRRAAALGRGTFTAVASVERVTAEMDDLFARIEAPLLRDVVVSWADPTAEAWPERVPDLYLGEPIVVTARLHGDSGPMSVEGLQADQLWRADVPAATEVPGAGLDKLWAGQKVQALLDSLTAGADAGEVKRAVTELGLAHRLLTPFTSFVVIEEEPVRPPEAPLVSCRIPGAVPRGTPPSNIALRATPPANASLDPDVDSRVEDVITVTAESPLLDERRISVGATVSQTELEKIPTARDPWAVLQSTPGVLADRINVGGNQSGEQSRYVGPGSPMGQATWSVDGTVVTDMAALGTSPAHYDFDAFEELQVSTGGPDVTIATGGVSLNMVTKRGTNEWRGSGRYFLADGSWQSDAGVSPSDLGKPGPWNRNAENPAGSAQPAIARGNRVVSVADFGAEVGGPIVRDRLWAWGAYGVQSDDLLTLADQPDAIDIATANLKLNAQVTGSNSATLLVFDSDRAEIGDGAGPFRMPETTWRQSRSSARPTAAKVEDTEIFSASFYLTGLYSSVDSGFRLTPRGSAEEAAFLDGQGVWHHTFEQIASERPQRKLETDASVFFNTGHASHELKLGAGYREAETRFGSRWGGAGYTLSSESVDDTHALLYAARDSASAATNDYTSAYVQDTVSAGHFTVNLGLRYDLQQGRLGASRVRANPVFPGLLPAATHGGGDAGFAWRSIVPRLGLTYAVGTERRTLVRASYSRFADQLGDSINQLAPLATPSYVYFLVDETAAASGIIAPGDVVDRNGNGVVDLGDSVGVGGHYDPFGHGVLAGDSVDPGLQPPTTDEVLAAVEHALLPELVVGLGLTYRRLSGLLENELLVFDGDPYSADNAASLGRLHTRADYVPVTVSGPGGLPDGRDATFTYWQLRPGVASRGGTRLVNGDREQRYLGASLTLHRRLANRWMLRGDLTWSDWSWRVPPGELEDPTRVLGAGFDGESVLQGPGSGLGAGTNSQPAVFINSSWSYRVNALYQIAPDRPWGFDLSLGATGRQGYPLPYYQRLAFGERDGIPGITSVQVAGNDDFRLADVHVLDAGIEKELVFRDFGVTLGADCFNLLDTRAVTQRNNRLGVGATAAAPLGPASDFVTEVVGPRIFRVGVRIVFR